MTYVPVKDHELDSIDTIYPEYRNYHEADREASRYAHDDRSSEAETSRGKLTAAKQKAIDASQSAMDKAHQVGGSVAETVKRAVAKSRDWVDHSTEALGSAGHAVGSAGGSAASGVASAASDGWQATTSAASSVRDVAGTGIEKLVDGVSQTTHYLSKTSQQLTDGATQTMKDTTTRVREGADKRPLGMALAALAAGVVAGMLIPTTRKEDQWFGEHADDLKDMAKEAAIDAKDRAKSAAAAAISSGRDQGLNPTDLASKVGHVAAAAKDAAIDAASETAEDEGITPQQVKDKAAKAAQDGKTKAAHSS